jgi:cellulose synthase (UDP-forming)
LLEPAAAHRKRAAELREKVLTHDELAREFEHLGYLFKVRISAFERKRYTNLSQASTKAANLNSYVGLMGRSFDVEAIGGHRFLTETTAGSASISVPDAPYIIILDADSILLPNFATCMLSALESPNNQRVAVMQTPYTTIPNTPNLIEKAAAATTDIYYYVTEGMSFAQAGSWIGAAAAIRKEALTDIVVFEEERGYQIPIYIQDKTVIEDTGATIDLARKNWRVQNYPARLSYSATPPDFGALVIQRRRWSNGGLIILPNVLRYLAGLRFHPRHTLEALLRIHYMVMPACISISMLAMLLYPFNFKYVSSWIYITLPPYIYLVCRDLALTGYRRRDFFKAYTLFLILLPVVLAGVMDSIVQILSGNKTSFGRTPKVSRRTAAPATIHLGILGLLVWSGITARDDIMSDTNQLHAVFALSNVLALGYGVVFLIGVRETVQDLFLPIRLAAASVLRRNRSTAAEEIVADFPKPAPLLVGQAPRPDGQLVEAPLVAEVNAQEAPALGELSQLPEACPKELPLRPSLSADVRDLRHVRTTLH